MRRSNNDTPVVFADGFPGWNGETPNTPRPGWAIEEYLEQLVHTAAVLALPPVTEENNGDFMTVVDGEWAPADVTLDEKIAADVDEWLEDHPEATTTVQDGAITFPKLAADLKSLLVHDTVSGPVASFDYAAGGLPFDSVIATLFPIQDLHGYDHPWPGGGGANRLNPATVPEEGGNILRTNGLVNPNPSWRYSDYIPVIPGEVLYFGEVYANASTAGTAYYDSNKVYVSGFSATSLKNSDGVMTVPEGVAFMRHSWLIEEGYNENWETTVYIIPNSSPHEFTPYANICPISGLTGLSVYVGPTTAQADATTYAVDWTSEAGTVYGGTLDVVTGVLTVDRAMVDLGTLTWGVFETYYTASVQGSKVGVIGAICSSMEVVYPNRDALTNVYQLAPFNGSGRYISALKGDYATAADFKAAMSGVQLCYELDTPLTYQLTPKQIAALTENYVWASNGGNVSVTFIADTKSYIDRKIAEAMAAALNA